MLKASNRRNKAVFLEEFVFNEPPTARCHASTIAESEEGLVTVWFGEKEEGAPDVDIWLNRKTGDQWSQPVDVAFADVDCGSISFQKANFYSDLEKE